MKTEELKTLLRCYADEQAQVGELGKRNAQTALLCIAELEPEEESEGIKPEPSPMPPKPAQELEISIIGDGPNPIIVQVPKSMLPQAKAQTATEPPPSVTTSENTPPPDPVFEVLDKLCADYPVKKPRTEDDEKEPPFDSGISTY